MIRPSSFKILDIVPLLLIEGDLHQDILRVVDGWHVPVPLVDVQVFRWDFDLIGHRTQRVRIDESNPHPVTNVRPSKHETKALVSLVIGTVRGTTVWIVVRGVRSFIVVKGQLFVQITCN